MKKKEEITRESTRTKGAELAQGALGPKEREKKKLKKKTKEEERKEEKRE